MSSNWEASMTSVLTRVRGKRQRRELYKRKAEARVAVPHAREHVRSPAAAKGREGKVGTSEKLMLVTTTKEKCFPVGFPSGQPWGMQTLSLVSSSFCRTRETFLEASQFPLVVSVVEVSLRND